MEGNIDAGGREGGLGKIIRGVGRLEVDQIVAEELRISLHTFLFISHLPDHVDQGVLPHEINEIHDSTITYVRQYCS